MDKIQMQALYSAQAVALEAETHGAAVVSVMVALCDRGLVYFVSNTRSDDATVLCSETTLEELTALVVALANLVK